MGILERKNAPCDRGTAPSGHRLPSTATRADEVHLHIGLDAPCCPFYVRDPLIYIRDAGGVYARTQRLPGGV